MNFYEHPSKGSSIFPFGRMDGRTDMRKLTVAYRNFANVTKI
jgi:hypothetical protein